MRCAPIQHNLGENGLDWLCYLAGNFQTAPMIFSYFQDIFLNDFIKNPQTRNARAFLPINISTVGRVQIILTDLIALQLQTLVLTDELLEVQLIVELNFLQLCK